MLCDVLTVFSVPFGLGAVVWFGIAFDRYVTEFMGVQAVFLMVVGVGLVLGCKAVTPFILSLMLAPIARARYRAGHCSHCQYDLRGAEHDRCPECGASCILEMNAMRVARARQHDAALPVSHEEPDPR